MIKNKKRIKKSFSTLEKRFAKKYPGSEKLEMDHMISLLSLDRFLKSTSKKVLARKVKEINNKNIDKMYYS